MSISAIRIAAPAKASAAMIVIHGLGDSGKGWTWLADSLHSSDDFKHINFIFPNAPTMPITVNGGSRMPAWFDIYKFGDPNAKQDIEGFLATTDKIKQLINNEIDAGIPANRIIIGGFSQGGAISLATASTFDKKLAGVISLSGFLSIRDAIAPRITDANKETPFFHGHGDMDPAISISDGKQTSEIYKGFGFKNFDFQEYPGMAHSTCDEEIQHIVKFVQTNLPKV